MIPNLHDNRWSLSITIIGDIWVQDELPGINAMSVEMSWVAPIEQADDYGPLSSNPFEMLALGASASFPYRTASNRYPSP